MRDPVGSREKVNDMNQLVIELGPEVFATHHHGLVIDHAIKAYLFDIIDAVKVFAKLSPKLSGVEQSKNAGESLNMFPFEVVD